MAFAKFLVMILIVLSGSLDAMKNQTPPCSLFYDGIESLPSEYEMRSLIRAALFGTDQNLKQLLNDPQQRRLVTMPDEKGLSLLHYAAMRNRASVIRLLLKEGVVADYLSPAQLTPLHIASYRCNYKAIVVLLLHGADVNAFDVSGFTPLHYAVKHFNKNSSIENVVSMLIAAGAQVNAPSIEGRLPLDYAARNGYAAAVSQILASNARIEARDLARALRVAEAYKQPEVAQILKEYARKIS